MKTAVFPSKPVSTIIWSSPLIPRYCPAYLRHSLLNTSWPTINARDLGRRLAHFEGRRISGNGGDISEHAAIELLFPLIHENFVEKNHAQRVVQTFQLRF